MGKKTKNNNRISKKILQWECMIFLLVVLCVFPLAFHDYYYDILEFKSLFFLITASVFCVAIVFTVFVQVLNSWIHGNRDEIKHAFKSITFANWTRLPIHIWLLSLFWLGCFFSTWLSDYRVESLTGSAGRYSGFVMISLYVLTTLFLVKYAKIKKWFLDAFLVTAILVAVLGITDFFRLDVLGFKAMETGNPAADVFTSTIGNVNTYTAFLALPLGIAAVFFGIEQRIVKKLLYFAIVLILYIAMLTGQSDNVYLSLAIMFCTLPFFLMRSKNGIASYVLLIAGLISSVLLVHWIKISYEERIVSFRGIFDILAGLPGLKLFAFLLWGLGIGMLIWSYKESHSTDFTLEGKTYCYLRKGWALFLALSLLTIIIMVYDANVGGHAERYGRFGSYMFYNDSWGSGRGYAWRIALEEYKELPSWQRVFGSGPDTYGLLTEAHYQESLERYNVYFESAHNEYLQYYVTIGPATTFIYIAFLIAAIVEMIKKGMTVSWFWGPCMAVICYVTQAIVNISIPIAAAVMWTVLAIGLTKTEKE